jgi:hypothetical protein
MQGLSLRNLDYMKAFAEAWSDDRLLQNCRGAITSGSRTS